MAQITPAFVEVPGRIVARPPFLAADVLMQAHAVKGDITALQKIVDASLNAPAGGTLVFRVVTSYIALITLFIARIQSQDPQDKQRGYVKEADSAFWILVFGGPESSPLSWQLHWMPVYMFVDCAPALAVGREMFGYPKDLGTFARKSSIDNSADFVLSALAYKTEGLDEVATQQEIFSVSSRAVVSAVADTTPETVRGSWRTLIEGDARRLEQTILKEFSLPTLDMPMIFLKQFRDIARPGGACYQAIAVCDTKTVRVSGIGNFANECVLTVNALESHPIAADLGLAGSVCDLQLSFWLKQDFTAGFGKTIWQA